MFNTICKRSHSSLSSPVQLPKYSELTLIFHWILIFHCGTHFLSALSLSTAPPFHVLSFRSWILSEVKQDTKLHEVCVFDPFYKEKHHWASLALETSRLHEHQLLPWLLFGCCAVCCWTCDLIIYTVSSVHLLATIATISWRESFRHSVVVPLLVKSFDRALTTS